MYILIRIEFSGDKYNEMVAKKKSLLVSYIKNKGYYQDLPGNRYIDDRTHNTGIDYVIESITELD